MAKSYEALIQEKNQMLIKMNKAMPEVMSSFQALNQATSKEGVLDKKTKELVGLGIAIATHCDGCIGFHVQALVRLGITREELMETLGMAIYMGGGPSLMYAADALTAFEEFSAT